MQNNVDMAGCLEHQHFIKEISFFGLIISQAHRQKGDIPHVAAVSATLILPFYGTVPTPP